MQHFRTVARLAAFSGVRVYIKHFMGRKNGNVELHILQTARRVERPDFTTVFVKITHGFAAISRAFGEGLGGLFGRVRGEVHPLHPLCTRLAPTTENKLKPA